MLHSYYYDLLIHGKALIVGIPGIAGATCGISSPSSGTIDNPSINSTTTSMMISSSSQDTQPVEGKENKKLFMTLHNLYYFFLHSSDLPSNCSCGIIYSRIRFHFSDIPNCWDFHRLLCPKTQIHS